MAVRWLRKCGLLLSVQAFIFMRSLYLEIVHNHVEKQNQVFVVRRDLLNVASFFGIQIKIFHRFSSIARHILERFG